MGVWQLISVFLLILSPVGLFFLGYFIGSGRLPKSGSKEREAANFQNITDEN